MNDDRQDELITEAWRILGELIEKGEAKLKGGAVLVPREDTMVRTFQWVAGLRKPRKKTGALPADFKPKVTARTEHEEDDTSGGRGPLD